MFGVNRRQHRESVEMFDGVQVAVNHATGIAMLMIALEDSPGWQGTPPQALYVYARWLLQCRHAARDGGHWSGRLDRHEAP